VRKIHAVDLTEKEKFRLKVVDAYEAMDPKNVRYLCKLMSIHHSTFYRLRKQYKRFNLNTLKYRSRRPKSSRTIPWNLVIEICRLSSTHFFEQIFSI